jgi:membrane-associated PAP2 superfamily phosphatase
MKTLPATHPPAGGLASDAAGLLSGLCVLVAWDRSALDLPVARLFGDAHGFVWQDHWLTAGLMHAGAHGVSYGLVLLLLVGVWRPLPFARCLTRRERLWWLMTTLACALVVAGIRRASATSCPWALAEFGGATSHYVPHWAVGQHDGGPGGCFPSAHAAAAFALLPGWFALRDRAPGAAGAWLAIALIAGLLFGAVQVVRGAHYPSHVLWSGWICWAIAALSQHLGTKMGFLRA